MDSSVVANVMRRHDKRVLFASKWCFKPEGVARVEEELGAVFHMGHQITNFDWDEKNAAFRLVCMTACYPQVVLALAKIVGAIIKQEIGENYQVDTDSEDEGSVRSQRVGAILTRNLRSADSLQMFSSRLIQPIKGVALSTETNSSISSAPTGANGANKRAISGVGNLEFKYTWTSQRKFDLVATPNNLSQVSRLAGCLVRLSNDTILLASNSQQAVDHATTMLDMLLKSELVAEGAVFGHLCYSEENENFEVALKRILDIKHPFFKTTLLDKLATKTDQEFFSILKNALTGRCALWDMNKSFYTPIKDQKCIRVTLEEQRNDPDRLWSGYQYPSTGNPDPNIKVPASTSQHGGKPARQPVLRASPELPLQTRLAELDINQWVNAVPSLGHETYLIEQPLKIKDVKPSWDSYKPLEEKDLSVIPNRKFSSAMSRSVSLSKMITKGPQRATSFPRSESQSSVQMPTLPSNRGFKPSVSPNNHLSTPPRQISSGFDTENNQPSSLLLDDISPLLVSFPALNPVKRQQTNHSESRMQQSNEPNTRVYHETMKQMAPNPGKGSRDRAAQSARNISSRPSRSDTVVPEKAIDPNPEFINEMKVKFEELMKNVRPFRGDILVQVEIGRILLGRLPKKFITTPTANRCIDPGKLESVLGNGAMTVFTKLVTSVPTDIQYLIDMKIDRQAMWQVKPSDWEVKYEFIFEFDDYGSSWPFTIEIRADNGACRIRTPKDLGTIYTHAIKRYFDFQITAAGYGDGQENRDKYGPVAESIKNTLFVLPGQETPVLRFELAHELHQKFRLEAVRVHRIRDHRSTEYDGTILRVSEVQELCSAVFYLKEQGVWIYDNKVVPAEDVPGCIDLWYELSIVSSLLDQNLKQNKDIPLGDQPSWAPSDISDIKVAEKLCIPACQMLKRMDGVGFYNDNGIELEHESQFSSAPTQVSTAYDASEVSGGGSDVYW